MDPCVHYFCTSLCIWNEQDCKNFEPGPPSLECPYAKCEEIEKEHSLAWLWILLSIAGGSSLGKKKCYMGLGLSGIRGRGVGRQGGIWEIFLGGRVVFWPLGREGLT